MSNSFKHRLTLIRDLTLTDWFLVIEAWWTLLWVSLSLRFSNLENVQKSIHIASSSAINSTNSLAFAQRLQKLVYLASRLHLPPAACLQRSLTLQRMLAKQGINSQLCIGVNDKVDTVFAHAWVQINDQPIGESEDIQTTFKILEPLNR